MTAPVSVGPDPAAREDTGMNVRTWQLLIVALAFTLAAGWRLQTAGSASAQSMPPAMNPGAPMTPGSGGMPQSGCASTDSWCAYCMRHPDSDLCKADNTATASSSMVSSGETSLTHTTATYRVELDISPAAMMLMPDQAPGKTSDEVMVQMPGMAMPAMAMTDQGQPVNHHLEVHISNKLSGAAVTNVMPNITIMDEASGMSRTLQDVMAMYHVPQSDLCFGNNVYLPDGQYKITVKVGSETVEFSHVAVSGGMPLSMGSTMPASLAMP
jgi:hypothetical protein